MLDKDIHSIFRGYMYPSNLTARCPRFHRCIVSNKCQSYDPHQPDCAVCETRVDPPGKLGGLLPEGKYMPDLQDAVHTIEELQHRPFAHRDAVGQPVETERAIDNKMNRIRKSIDMCKQFMDTGVWNMEEKVVRCLYDTEQKKLLGRIE